jgi:cobaltochelatase CobS
MRTPSYDAAALEAEIGPRGGTVVNTANRGLVQNWLVAKGCPSARAKAMQVKTLWKMYNRERYCDFVLTKIAAGGAVPDDDGSGDAAFALPTAALAPAPADYTAPVPAAAPAATVPALAAAPGDAAGQLAALIQTLAAGAINEARVVELIREHAPKPRQTEIVVTVPVTGERLNIGAQHRQFETLLRACAARDHNGNRLNVMMAGPPGSGKTTAAENVAKALGLPFRFNGAIDNEYKLLGFTDAQGRVVSRPFREIYQNGGVYLFDEIDGSLPGAVLAFNAATANGYCDFPDGPIARHPDCVLIAAGNTAGHGATDQFTGRTKLDLAFLDRFALLIWEIDESLETATCPDPAWCEYVQAVRRRVAEHGIPRAIVSPRASYMGAGFLAAGLDRETVVGMVLRKGMSADQWQAVA